MVTRGVMAMELVLVVLFAIIPIIASIYMLAKKTIKGSCFFCGVIGYVCAFIAIGIVGGIFTVANMSKFQSDPLGFAQSNSYLLPIGIITVILIQLSILFSAGKVIKNRRNFNEAVSFGLGYSVVNLVVVGFSGLTNYTTSASINSGAFDLKYRQLIDMGAMTKEQLIQTKAVYTDINILDLLVSIPDTILSAFVMLTIAIAIVYGLKVKKGFLIFLITSLINIVIVVVALLLDKNVFVSLAIDAVLAVIAFFFIKKVKDKMVDEPDSILTKDSFIDSVNAVQNESK